MRFLFVVLIKTLSNTRAFMDVVCSETKITNMGCIQKSVYFVSFSLGCDLCEKCLTVGNFQRVSFFSLSLVPFCWCVTKTPSRNRQFVFFFKTPKHTQTKNACPFWHLLRLDLTSKREKIDKRVIFWGFPKCLRVCVCLFTFLFFFIEAWSKLWVHLLHRVGGGPNQTGTKPQRIQSSRQSMCFVIFGYEGGIEIPDFHARSPRLVESWDR